MSQFEFIDKRVPIALDNPSIYHDISKCKNCTLCRRACADVMSVLDYYDLESTGDVPMCIHCGQCAAACPFDSMHARSELDKVKALGADYVVDTNFGADLTIMEEASELVDRLKNGGTIPQFTSCCPAWVRFAEIYFPELIPNLSSTRSCIAMEAAMIKTYFAEKKGINPANIVSVSVNPCTAKKAETKRVEENAAARYYDDESLGMDTDISITTREFIRWLNDEGVDFGSLEDSKFDDLIGMETGASIIFGNTGGV
ncbi:MAG: [Fe-Fe] hydrogenase large subunit C-terminal domain-containing protein, partial [Veillonella sp.]|nr:[Fe-Fe] hydrogenase large subunit C-terminal domain-containing protein [Veillonella sp.]